MWFRFRDERVAVAVVGDDSVGLTFLPTPNEIDNEIYEVRSSASYRERSRESAIQFASSEVAKDLNSRQTHLIGPRIVGSPRETLTEEMVAARAKEINPEKFVSFFTYGADCDPYGFLRAAVERGELDRDDPGVRLQLGQSGRIWWVRNPDDDGFPVTAGDLMEEYPNVDWNEIYAREEQWSRDLDRFHGLLR